MNTLRAYFFTVAGIIYLAILLFCAHSCSVTDCLGVACKNGTCIDGKCNCDANYEGKTCDTVIRNTFLGVFNVTSSCWSVDDSTYPGEIEYVTSSNFGQVEIINLANLRMDVYANINGNNALTIPIQYDTEAGYTWAIQGTGTLDRVTKDITFHIIYMQTANSINDTCTEVYNRK